MIRPVAESAYQERQPPRAGCYHASRRHLRPILGLTAILLSGCVSIKDEGAKVDDTYRKRVKSFSITYTVAPPAVIATWTYNPPFGPFADDAK